MKLRPATTDDDRRLIWEWACDPDTLRATRDPKPPPWDTHVAWFARDDPLRVMFMALADNDTPFGEIRFDRDAAESSTAGVSVNLAPASRGQGLGTELIHMATQRYLHETVGVHRVIAWVKQSNPASIRAFEKAGYARTGATDGEVQLTAARATQG